MKIPFGRTRRMAFTLVEVLVGIALLSIMIVFLGAMASSLGSVSHGALQNAENSSNARAILDLLCRELAAGVSRPDLNQANWITVSISNSGSTLGFYSRNTGSAIAAANAGTPNTYRPLSYIQYTWYQSSTNSYLARGDQAVLWSDSPSSSIPLGYSAATHAVLGVSSDVLDGVVGFRVAFLQQNGTFSTTYSSTGTLAATVSLALLDADSLKILYSSSKLQQLSNLLTSTNAVSNTSPKMDWENAVNSPTGMSGYPQQVKTGLRFFERTVDLPKPIL